MVDRIRPARPDELGRLFEIWQSAVERTHSFVSAADMAEIARLVRDEYLPKAELWIIVDAHDRALGFLGRAGDELESLFIDAAHHGCGLGRALVEHVFPSGTAVRADVNEQNEGARRFYERLGFAVVGRSGVDSGGRPYPLLHLRRAVI